MFTAPQNGHVAITDEGFDALINSFVHLDDESKFHMFVCMVACAEYPQAVSPLMAARLLQILPSPE